MILLNGIKAKAAYIHDPSNRDLHCFVNGSVQTDVEILMTIKDKVSVMLPLNNLVKINWLLDLCELELKFVFVLFYSFFFICCFNYIFYFINYIYKAPYGDI